jgi:hypothetical protein
MNKHYLSTLGFCFLAGTLSCVPYVLARSDAPLFVSLGNETPAAETLCSVPRVLAQADRTAPSPEDRSNDIAITANTRAALSADKRTAGAADAIHVQTNEGVVTLTGDVASQATAEHAQRIAARLLGVRDVVNDLKYPHLPGSNSVPIVAPPNNTSGL